MKRKKMLLFAVFIMVVFININLSKPILPTNSSLSIKLLEAKADGETVENRDPNEDPTPDGSQPKDWFALIIDFLF